MARPRLSSFARAWALAGMVGFASCTGPQSALEPAGRGAERIAYLFWWMTAGSMVVWLVVIALTVYVIRAGPDTFDERRARVLIIGGGALVPTLVLAGLLVYGLAILPGLMAPAPPGSLRIAVTGEQWWWRVRYEPADGEPVETANEIRLPVGEPVQFELDSPDVIHSFWIPALGGKVDMIPGRRTRLVLEPTRAGVFRGVCAEYCGTAHAHMAFDVIVMEKSVFADWLGRQRQPAVDPTEPRETRGRDHFFANGCAACHTVAGTEARGQVGPNLTHVGSRRSVGAGTVPNDTDGFIRWLERTNHVKPGVHMPHFGMLPRSELNALAAYMESLQ